MVVVEMEMAMGSVGVAPAAAVERTVCTEGKLRSNVSSLKSNSKILTEVGVVAIIGGGRRC